MLPPVVGLHLHLVRFLLLLHLKIKAYCRLCGRTTRASRRRVGSESSLHTDSTLKPVDGSSILNNKNMLSYV
ncbi:hypothetical protein Y032_0077g1094 [Ancylostoma ceylanicum]|uniref:Secreted protein n=1 Tax=Ancylostoma ceylanicum TaxID=53326 RepID=A0A016TTZ4_9BILA|nr:hypothetical protein Y032_0077g1094 [Ancylostoma ceylanicum]